MTEGKKGLHKADFYGIICYVNKMLVSESGIDAHSFAL